MYTSQSADTCTCIMCGAQSPLPMNTKIGQNDNTMHTNQRRRQEHNINIDFVISLLFGRCCRLCWMFRFSSRWWSAWSIRVRLVFSFSFCFGFCEWFGRFAFQLADWFLIVSKWLLFSFELTWWLSLISDAALDLILYLQMLAMGKWYGNGHSWWCLWRSERFILWPNNGTESVLEFYARWRLECATVPGRCNRYRQMALL